MNTSIQKLKEKAPGFAQLLLRIGMTLVFLWFGIQQILHAQSWVGFLPSFTQALPLSQVTFVHLNGWFEVTFAILLLAGFYTRIVAFILAIHLLGIAISVGISPTGVRDFGLFVGTFTIFLLGAPRWSVDEFFDKRTVRGERV